MTSGGIGWLDNLRRRRRQGSILFASWLGATLALCVAAVPAQAQLFRRLVNQIEDPSPPLIPDIDRVLGSHPVGEVSLGEALTALQFEGCLDRVREDLVLGLSELRALHVRGVETRSLKRVWSIWERKLRLLSPESYLLVTTWLDSPATARRLYFCEDGLPPSWKSLPPQAYLVEAITWFDIEVADREHALQTGQPGDRELAVMELMELREALVDRFRNTYPADAEHLEPLGLLQERLGAMWAVMVDPYHLGFTPAARTEDTKAPAGSLGSLKPQSPFSGVGIPDPRDLAARSRVVRSWKRQQRVLNEDLERIEDELDDTLASLSAADLSLEDLNARTRAAARLDARLAQTHASIQRMGNRILYRGTGRSWVDSMLDNGYRRRAVRRLDRKEKVLLTERERTESAIEDAVARGATRPGGSDEDDSGGGQGQGLPVASGRNWLEGLPGVENSTGSTVTPTIRGGIPKGTGWVERIYEGPLPTPSASWDADLVAAILGRYPNLDATDARILLGLVRLAYKELDSRNAVEAAVWRSLTEEEGLRIRGEESTLSDLWTPGKDRSEQPVVTFVLTLWF